ncbi:probable N-acetylmuramoyl-L-alanine amidase [Psychrobacter arcticus 273-4]|uniref:N-acetylmuramoyl-L-alanine amidase n=1 Tax=Psychrobacter arcticus (strain DSM 17307 / VKM B-2377 / 273-4) TaxID=259536 RepID=Q4FUK5_PSYA2|nr:N-acetylmuramoyl-L-alanine amidase [Psychrobacter arcticus]AAZ18303.1 probable N-acetylmuramoyl-L-alanine amidase [Psychrobacter arcticus 273-4]
MTTVVITAGHSNTDPGAVNGNITEAEIATDMRNMVTLYLERKDIDVVTDGNGSDNQTLRNAIKLIKQGKVAIEFHCNAFHLPTSGGVEALAQPKDKVICQKLCEAVSDIMGIPVRGPAGGFKAENSGQHSRLGYVRGGGIILELFFISNPLELATYQAKKWLIARELADVIAEHVGIGCKA